VVHVALHLFSHTLKLARPFLFQLSK